MPRSTACSRSSGRCRASAGPSRRSLPGAVPWTSANRSASAPNSSIVLERIDHVALRLRHLLAVRVPDEARQVDGVEGRLAGSCDAQHHHPGDPEEEDVVARSPSRSPGSSAPGPALPPASRASRTATARCENHVSKMSGSWSAWRRGAADLARRRARRRSAITVTWPSGQYQAGIRWPHHSWRRDVPVADVGHPVLPDLLEPLAAGSWCGPTASPPGPRLGQRRRCG